MFKNIKELLIIYVYQRILFVLLILLLFLLPTYAKNYSGNDVYYIVIGISCVIFLNIVILSKSYDYYLELPDKEKDLLSKLKSGYYNEDRYCYLVEDLNKVYDNGNRSLRNTDLLKELASYLDKCDKDVQSKTMSVLSNDLNIHAHEGVIIKYSLVVNILMLINVGLVSWVLIDSWLFILPIVLLIVLIVLVNIITRVVDENNRCQLSDYLKDTYSESEYQVISKIMNL